VHFSEKKNSEIFSLNGPRENVSPGPAAFGSGWAWSTDNKAGDMEKCHAENNQKANNSNYNTVTDSKVWNNIFLNCP